MRELKHKLLTVITCWSLTACWLINSTTLITNAMEIHITDESPEQGTLQLVDDNNYDGDKYTGDDVYSDNSFTSKLYNCKIYDWDSNSVHNVNADNQHYDSYTVPFSDPANYNGTSLVRGNSPSSPIYLSNTADYYALIVNLYYSNSSYKTKYYLLTGSIRGAQDLTKYTFTGQINYGGHWIKWANNTLNKALNYSVVNPADYLYYDISVLQDGKLYISSGNYSDYYDYVIANAQIKIESKETRTGKTIVMFDLYDGSSTITCKSFVVPEKFKEVMSRLKDAKGIKLEGVAKYDPYLESSFRWLYFFA